MSEEILNRLLRNQAQVLEQQGLIMGMLHQLKETVAEFVLRIRVVEEYIERIEKPRP